MSSESAQPPAQAGSDKKPWMAILFLFIAIIYGILPLDLVPDLIPVFGLGDDAMIILGSLYYFYSNFIKK